MTRKRRNTRSNEEIEAYAKQTGDYDVAILEVLLDLRNMVREYLRKKLEEKQRRYRK